MTQQRCCNRCQNIALGLVCTECQLWFCDNCYNTHFGNGCHCHKPLRDIAGDMVTGSYSGILAHAGHKIEIVWYGTMPEPSNVSIECKDCMYVIVDFNFKEPPKRRKKK